MAVSWCGWTNRDEHIYCATNRRQYSEWANSCMPETRVDRGRRYGNDSHRLQAGGGARRCEWLPGRLLRLLWMAIGGQVGGWHPCRGSLRAAKRARLSVRAERDSGEPGRGAILVEPPCGERFAAGRPGHRGGLPGWEPAAPVLVHVRQPASAAGARSGRLLADGIGLGDRRGRLKVDRRVGMPQR